MTNQIRAGRGDWMQTHTGKAFYPLAPRVEDVDITDIAHALGNICRYNGHTRRFYSVAEHCVLLAHHFLDDTRHNWMTEKERLNLALWALLHDAPEAYIGDMIRPLKRNMPDFQAIDDELTALIAQRYELVGTEIPVAVKRADTAILNDERDALHFPPPQEWDVPAERLGVTIEAWEPSQARRRYLAMFERLTQGRFGR